MTIKISQKDGNWQFGTIGGVMFNVKIYDEPSDFGVNNGKISKLWLDGMANYDRGWDRIPQTPKAIQRVKELVEYFDKQ